MFDETDDILRVGRRGQITANITYLMLKGAGYAAVFCLVIWFSLAALAFIGRLLPEESRDTPDPINRSDVVIELPEAVTV